jgi:hypothetical protein
MANALCGVDKLIYVLEGVEYTACGMTQRALVRVCQDELEKITVVELVRWLAGQVRADCENRALVLLAEAGLATEGFCVWKEQDG